VPTIFFNDLGDPPPAAKQAVSTGFPRRPFAALRSFGAATTPSSPCRLPAALPTLDPNFLPVRLWDGENGTTTSPSGQRRYGSATIRSAASLQPRSSWRPAGSRNCRMAPGCPWLASNMSRVSPCANLDDGTETQGRWVSHRLGFLSIACSLLSKTARASRLGPQARRIEGGLQLAALSLRGRPSNVFSTN